jgi:peptidoglycan-associated lipoprotein
MLSLVASTATLFTGACSHEQKLTQVNAPPVARAEEPHKASPPPLNAPVPIAVKAPEKEAIFFDFDSSLLRNEARPVLQEVATEVRGKEKELRVEGNCDELGTVEYNIALGDHRARAAKDYLVHLGVPPNRIQTVSYGSQRPKFAGHDDDARAKNRRDDFVLR